MVEEAREVNIILRVPDADTVRKLESENVGDKRATDNVEDVFGISGNNIVLAAHAHLEHGETQLHQEDESSGEDLRSTRPETALSKAQAQQQLYSSNGERTIHAVLMS